MTQCVFANKECQCQLEPMVPVLDLYGSQGGLHYMFRKLADIFNKGRTPSNKEVKEILAGKKLSDTASRAEIVWALKALSIKPEWCPNYEEHRKPIVGQGD